MTEPAADDPAEPVDLAQLPGDVATFVERLQGYLATLAAIGTPDAIEAIDAALTTMSGALQLAAAAMAAVAPTSH